MLNKILLWVLEKQLPNLTQWLLNLFTVDEVVAKIDPLLGNLLAQLPQPYRPQVKTMLRKVGEVFINLSD